MITSLKLKNIALIENAEIDFSSGFNVLSGETGAGKSVIINGINFALGTKADKNMIRFGENFCQAEIVFDNVNNSEVLAVLEDLGIDFDDQIIIKRRFFSDGRGDIKVNGNTVTLNMLKTLTSVLCDVYGQSEHYSLLNKNNQLKVLDNFCVSEIEPIKAQIKPLILDIKEFKRSDLRSLFGMVLQDTWLFSGSIADNIRYGRLNATREEIIEAAKTANADSFIDNLPDGYDTMLNNAGANLSQGQRQLLSIARAAVANPIVLVLDEATSSIDTRTELLIENGMNKLMKNKTTFVIAHRLSTVKNANAIMVLENGKIIERGDHDVLLEEKGRYYELYTGMFELE